MERDVSAEEAGFFELIGVTNEVEMKPSPEFRIKEGRAPRFANATGLNFLISIQIREDFD
jgi:hypothetical protein